MTPPPRTGRTGWIIAGTVTWLILAASITLEAGRHSTAQWGSITALGLIVLILVIMMLRTVTRGVRTGNRLLRRHIRSRR